MVCHIDAAEISESKQNNSSLKTEGKRKPSAGTGILLGRGFFHSLVFAIAAWPLENKGNFIHFDSFWNAFPLYFAVWVEITCKGLFFQCSYTNQGEKALLACLSIHGAAQWKPFRRGLRASVLKGPVPLSHTNILLCAGISNFPLEESDRSPPL